jgi:hypothetical protein
VIPLVKKFVELVLLVADKSANWRATKPRMPAIITEMLGMSAVFQEYTRDIVPDNRDLISIVCDDM